MAQIKIFQPETYPKNIVEVRNEIMNFSDDTFKLCFGYGFQFITA